MEIILLLFRILLAGIFALAGIAKFLDLKGSEKAFTDFGVPRSLAMTGAVALSVAEIAIAMFLLPVQTSWYAAIGASALLLLFIGQMIYQVAKGNAPDCHCFGQLHSAPVSKVSIARNILFAVPALILVVSGPTNQGMALTDPRLDVMQLVFGVAIVGFLAAMVVTLRKISTQQDELLRRVELMELVARDGAAVARDDVAHPHEGLPIGAPFPHFELPDLEGKTVTLAGLRDEGLPVLFFFVSPSCTPCKALVPEFEHWQRDLYGKTNVIFISSGKPEDNRTKFGGNAAKTILLQKDRELAALVKAQWTPTAVLMDAAGRVASHAAAADTAIRTLIEQIRSEDVRQEFAYFANGNGQPNPIKIGEGVPEFSLADIRGEQIDASYFRGKQTLVTFWSLTCPFCVNMMDDLREWDTTRTAEDPELIVFSDGDKAEHEKLGLRSPIILDAGYKTSAGLGMFGTPSAVLVNEDGKIISETAMGAPDIWSLIGKRK
jgi:peroxiredoxin/uncharacterized membrane protein YphA (DoxX/SURF4 family)